MSILDCKNKAVRLHDPCEELIEKARISNLVFLEKGQYEGLDKSSGAAFRDAILALEATCQAFVIRNCRGEYDGGEATTVEGRGRQNERFGGMNHAIVMTDFEIIPNVDFYNKLKYTSLAYDLIFMTESLAWPVIKQDLTVLPSVPISNVPTDDVLGEITIQWTGDNIPEPVDIDTSEWSYPQLAFTSITSAGDETVDEKVVSIATAGNLNCSVVFTPAATLWSVHPQSSLPAWVTLDPVTGALTGTAPGTPESNEFIIMGEDDCQTGQVSITLIVS